MSKDIGTLQDKKGNTIYPIGFEAITNSNGTAIKFPDGTMIQYASLSRTLSRTFVWNNWHLTPAQKETFPVPFVGTIPSLSILAYCDNVATQVITNGPPTLIGTNNYYIGSLDANINNRVHTIQYIAIGRWK